MARNKKDSEKRFSERFGYETPDAEITIRYEAPHELRGVVLSIAYEAGLSPSSLRTLICSLLRKRPNSSNWSEYPNIAQEVERLIDGCEWFEVYDVIEEIYETLTEWDRASFIGLNEESQAETFSRELNKYFRKRGIGWQSVDGHLQIRGPEAFEDAVQRAQKVLEETGRQTTSHEIHQALLDLSRRPMPDLTGAIQHALAALECIARDTSGDPKSTLGNILKGNPGLVPAPLDQAVEKAWGFASEYGRHLREGRNPKMEEAELLVGLASVTATYLAKKVDKEGKAF
jgi:hypothetical protein